MPALANFPDLPSSVGGQKIPDFLRFELVGDGKLPAPLPIKPEFDFSIKKSPVFGSDSGTLFDEGARWHPLREVHFAFADNTLARYQGHYLGRSTAPAGTPSIGVVSSLKLGDGEYITAIQVYLKDGVVSGLKIWTSEKQHESFGVTSTEDSNANTFQVPDDHHIVNFYGYINGNGQIHGLGASYCRRLASIAAKAPASNGGDPELKPIYSRTYLDADTQDMWNNNNMDGIEKKKSQASDDLTPIYQNIKDKGEDAWVHVRDPDTGEEYYLSWSDTATMWSYVSPAPSINADTGNKDVAMSIGSYSKTSNFLGVSGYIWSNIPAWVSTLPIGQAIAYMLKDLIQEGITWGIGFAADQFASYLAAAGAEEAAILVPASVASTGGLVIAGVIGMLVAFGLILLMNFIWKKYWLTIEVYNFDPDHDWISTDHYDDNASISKGAWSIKTIPKFAPANSDLNPPGFKPQTALDNVVTYLSLSFENDSTFLQGLGEGIVMARDDYAMGVALKYVVHRFKDNEVGLQGIESNPSSFDLSDYYNNSDWEDDQMTSTTLGKLDLTGFTPYLNGAPGDSYKYVVNLGLPPYNWN